MKEIFRSNDPVQLSFAEAVLKAEGIEAIILDQHMSVMEGSLGVLPRRLMVADADEHPARRLLEDAGAL
ncbi:MAG: hypothetical protein TEF_14300 [Rhizobiales bacterium NRL2]|mgnify:FL=1|jgi:hypothetical protein|nr:MAG: hypothetical protein TEF_14300 [Rhizobiales bacterium NRL2]